MRTPSNREPGANRGAETRSADEDSRPRVLVVDGDEHILRLLEIKLSRVGYNVSTVEDGEQGYLEARLGPADLVIVGDALGPLDSHSLLRALAELPARPAVVFLSASGDRADVERALRAGSDDYVLKPFSPNELVHRARVTLLRRELRGGTVQE